ncbi:hypothetical protein BOW52_09905 [Solemya elarraichensis gill symbiont]|uniref:Uncharacterized protein n=1 Tax=Solemya elarraichensis gill symbiont TaxID=1918949 RepID=A0A1T2KYU3_9GAMM|nr:hypothetical protein BOW52_09905 [Solemya elarraichensis gill symbiont]
MFEQSGASAARITWRGDCVFPGSSKRDTERNTQFDDDPSSISPYNKASTLFKCISFGGDPWYVTRIGNDYAKPGVRNE